MYPFLLWLRPPSCSVCLWQYPTFWRLQLGQGLAPTPVEPPLPETLVNSVLSISFNTPDCLIVTIGTVCENQDTSVFRLLNNRSIGAYPSSCHIDSFSGSCYSATAAAETHGCHIGCPERSETARLIGNLVADRAYRALLLPALHQVCQTSPSPWLAGYEGRVPRRFRLHQYAHGLRRRRPFCRVNEGGGDSPGIGPEPHRKS